MQLGELQEVVLVAAYLRNEVIARIDDVVVDLDADRLQIQSQADTLYHMKYLERDDSGEVIAFRRDKMAEIEKIVAKYLSQVSSLTPLARKVLVKLGEDGELSGKAIANFLKQHPSNDVKQAINELAGRGAAQYAYIGIFALEDTKAEITMKGRVLAKLVLAVPPIAEVAQPAQPKGPPAMLFSVIVEHSFHKTFETDEVIRFRSDRFIAPGGAEGKFDPTFLPSLENTRAILMYEIGGAEPHANLIRVGTLNDIQLVGTHIEFKFVDEGRLTRADIDEFDTRLGMNRQDMGHTHWGVKRGGIPNGLLQRITPTHSTIANSGKSQTPSVSHVNPIVADKPANTSSSVVKTLSSEVVSLPNQEASQAKEWLEIGMVKIPDSIISTIPPPNPPEKRNVHVQIPSVANLLDRVKEGKDSSRLHKALYGISLVVCVLIVVFLVVGNWQWAVIGGCSLIAASILWYIFDDPHSRHANLAKWFVVDAFGAMLIILLLKLAKVLLWSP